MKTKNPLNEGIEDLLQLGNIDDSSDINSANIIKLNKNKKKRVSFLDETPQQKPQQNTNEIVIPQPLAELHSDNIMKQVQKQDTKETLKEKSKVRGSKKDKTLNITVFDLPVVNEEVKKELEVILDKKLPENINAIQIEEDIDTALKEIPGGQDLDITDIEINPLKVERKDKTGYYKVKTNIKKNNIPDIINKISTYIKKKSKGLISPRVCDLRVIGNTNKTQLKNAKLKLSAATVVFKPNFEKLKVNKGTRFMISIPESFKTTGNLIVYLQESRDKTILELSPNDFTNQTAFIEFIGDRIAEYYFHGYDVTLKKLELRGTDNPLMQVISTILNTNEYKARPYTDADNHLFSVDFISKGTLNQWLIVNIIEEEVPGTYGIYAKNEVDSTWEYKIIQQPVTIAQLINKLYDVLKKSYEKDWTKELDIQDDTDVFSYNYMKLTHMKLKKAVILIHDKIEETPEIGVEIKKILSKKDLVAMLKKDYDSEAIIGKTNFLDYFILSFYAHQIIGGDPRYGKDYITTEDYYDKYNVKDRREYEEREKTILKKQGVERKYNARIYVFQLEYSVGKKVYIYRAKEFLEIETLTGFLTEEIKFPVTPF